MAQETPRAPLLQDMLFPEPEREESSPLRSPSLEGGGEGSPHAHREHPERGDCPEASCTVSPRIRQKAGSTTPLQDAAQPHGTILPPPPCPERYPFVPASESQPKCPGILPPHPSSSPPGEPSKHPDFTPIPNFPPVTPESQLSSSFLPGPCHS